MGYDRVNLDINISIKGTGNIVKFRDTDLHWYSHFVSCYNTESCRVKDVDLIDNVKPNVFYWLYYDLLGNLGITFR
jgi:hypothetical protein